jgi:hypothetical protein
LVFTNLQPSASISFMASLILICASKYASGRCRYSSFWILFSGHRESALRAAGKEGALRPGRSEKAVDGFGLGYIKAKILHAGRARSLNCFYEARKISTVSIVEFSNPELLSRLGLIYTDCFLCTPRVGLRASRANAPAPSTPGWLGYNCSGG